MAKTEKKEVAIVKAQPLDANPESLIRLAIEQNVDVDKLEKLMAMQERWNIQQSRKQFFEAISAFQSECPPLKRSKKVKFNQTNYAYAPLGEIASTIKATMRKHGLSHRWEMEDRDESMICSCIISHVSGHFEKSSMSAKKDTSGSKNEIQSRGSTITYLQRYTLIAALGISTADDDNDSHGTASVKEDGLGIYAEQISLITDLKGLQKYWEANDDMHKNKAFAKLVQDHKTQLQKK